MTNKTRKLSFVLYEDNFPPRYYSISKNILRFLLFGLPTVTLITLFIIAAGGIYFKQIQRLAQRKEPAIIKELRKNKEELIIAQEELLRERDKLQAKLGQGITNNDGLSFLALFKQSSGRQDLSSSPEMAIEDIEAITREKSIELSFKIVNMTKDESRLTGYLFVMMQVGEHLEVWPAGGFDDKAMQVSFGKGEFFATSRFRPVRSAFGKPSGQNALFKIVVFSRTGDLIFKQLVSRPI